MAQKRLRDFEEELLSFEHNIWNLGLHNPGRYAGYDTLVPNVGLEFTIAHTATGIKYKNQTFDEIGPLGIALTPQGMILSEDAAIALEVDTNAGNTQVRYDLVVLNHIYTSITGGSAGTYSIIKGTVGSPVKPVLADPFLQTAIGIIEIPANATDANVFIWHKSKCPDSGDGEDARLFSPNLFQAYQGLNKSIIVNSVTDTYTTGSHVSNLWTLGNDGSQFTMNVAHSLIDGIVIKDVPLQEGMRAYLLITNNHTVRESRYFEAEPTKYGKGYRGFTINPGLGNVVIPPSQNGGGSSFGIQPAVGETWELEVVLIDNRWYVAAINGSGTSSAFRRGMVMEWYGDVALNFDPEGKGINLMTGWQICNGNYASPDRRGKLAAMATNVPAAGRFSTADETAIQAASEDPEEFVLGNAFTVVGKKKFEILQGHLPNVFLDVDDPGHFHYVFADGTPGTDVNSLTTPIWTASLGGNPSYAIQGTGAAATKGKSQSVETNITVNTGGDGTRLEHTGPLFMTIWIIKL